MGHTFTVMGRSMAIVAGAILMGGATRAYAQGRPPRTDTTRGRDTAQRLPPATIREAPVNLPETFLRRSRIHDTGKYFTSKEIEKLNAPHTPQLLARISGGDIRDIGSGTSVIVGSRGTRMSMSSGVASELCVVGVAINDTRVPAGYDLKAIKQNDIAALEFYSGPASVPLELSAQMMSDADCGLFVIWLKDHYRKR